MNDEKKILPSQIICVLLLIVNNNRMKTATAYTDTIETIREHRSRRVAKAAATKQIEVPKTPESELMSVDEYFGMVWDRYLEKYEKLHG